MENELSRIVDALPGLVSTARPDGHVDFRPRTSDKPGANSLQTEPL